MLDHSQAEHSNAMSAVRPDSRESHHESLEPQLGAIPVSAVSPGRRLGRSTVADGAADPQDRLRYLRRSHSYRLPGEERAESSDYRTAERLDPPLVAALRRSNGGHAVSLDVGFSGRPAVDVWALGTAVAAGRSRLSAIGPAQSQDLAVSRDGGAAGSSPTRLGQVGSIIRRTEESATLLKELAEPKVFQGPDVELQKSIVQKLEQAIPDLHKETTIKRDQMEEEIGEWDMEFNHRKQKTNTEFLEHQTEKAKRRAALPPIYDSPLLYLGSIELTGIPASDEDDEDMIAGATLVETNNALGPNDNAIDLSRIAGVEQEVVENTLRTMIKAQQIEYLRKSGFVGDEWKIIVEVHYYRNRSVSSPNLHKDTLGQTLFVNLNYTNEEETAGPEFMVNPPLVQTHEDKIEQNLPGAFMDDLKQTRDGESPTEIRTTTLAPHSVVSFVDEAIHHATPLIGHRSVEPAGLERFLSSEPGFMELFAQAEDAYKKSRPTTGLWSFISSSPSFVDSFAVEVPTTLKTSWEAWMEICARGGNAKLQRPVFLESGMTGEQVDRLMTEYGEDGFNSVNIPSRARTNEKSGGRIPLAPEGDKTRRPALKREMSQRALDNNLPQVDLGPRRFFRTWVRAVRK